MSYIYMEHPFLMFLDLDLETSRMGAPYIYDISHLRVNRLNYEWNSFGLSTFTLH